MNEADLRPDEIAVPGVVPDHEHVVQLIAGVVTGRETNLEAVLEVDDARLEVVHPLITEVNTPVIGQNLLAVTGDQTRLDATWLKGAVRQDRIAEMVGFHGLTNLMNIGHVRAADRDVHQREGELRQGCRHLKRADHHWSRIPEMRFPQELYPALKRHYPRNVILSVRLP